MNQREFEDSVRKFMQRVPFEPFIVEMVDGRLIEISGEGLDLDNRGAPLLSPTHGIVELKCEAVRAIRKRAAADFSKLAAEIARKQGRTEAGMHPTQFDETLRKFIRAKPFMPFVVEMLDGRHIVISEPTVAFDAGGAIYVSDADIVRFFCEDVRTIRPEPQGAVA